MIRNFILTAFICILGKISFTQNIQTNKIDSGSSKILIINSFDAMSSKVRKNKKELLLELTDSLKNYLAKEIWFQLHRKSEIISGIIGETSSPDSLINALLEQNYAMKAIKINSTDVYFEAGNSRTVQEYGEKEKTVVRYNLCTQIKYTLYQKNENPMGKEIDNCKFFTERSTQGRFSIALGPDIVGKKKHTYGAIAANAAQYISIISLQLISQ